MHLLALSTDRCHEDLAHDRCLFDVDCLNRSIDRGLDIKVLHLNPYSLRRASKSCFVWLLHMLDSGVGLRIALAIPLCLMLG